MPLTPLTRQLLDRARLFGTIRVIRSRSTDPKAVLENADKEDAMVAPDATEFDGGCHCGAVRFHVRLDGGFAAARRCNCSLCRMRGAVALSALLDDFNILQGADKLTEYRFNTGEGRHYFCAVCGIYTHHKRRSNPHQLGINAACLEGVSPFDFAEVPVLDGVNHPRDAANSSGKGAQLGTLRYEPLLREG